jgi:hypothetical protein
MSRTRRGVPQSSTPSWSHRKTANHSQLIDFGFSFSLFYATSKGLGLHDYDIPPDDRPGLNRADYAFTVLYVSDLVPRMHEWLSLIPYPRILR